MTACIDGVDLAELDRPVHAHRASTSSRPRSRWPVPRSSSRTRRRGNGGCAARSQGSPIDYDVIFIDCPPSLGLLTVNALTAADAVLIPLQCEYYALEGLTQLLATIDLVRDHLNPAPRDRRRVLTMADARTNLSADVEAEARRHLGGAGLRDRHPAQRPPLRGARATAGRSRRTRPSHAAVSPTRRSPTEFRARHARHWQPRIRRRSPRQR